MSGSFEKPLAAHAMLTVTITQFAPDVEGHIIQEKTICLLGWVVYRWQERYAQQQPEAK